DVVLDVALAASHANFERLLRNGHVGEPAHPNLAAALHVAGHRATSRFELAGRHAWTTRRLQALLAEADIVAGLGQAGVAPLELLAILRALRLHHKSYLG